MGKLIFGILKGTWRVSGPILAGTLTQAATQDPWLALTVVAVTKVIIPGVKQYYKGQGKELPGWVISLPF